MTVPSFEFGTRRAECYFTHLDVGVELKKSDRSRNMYFSYGVRRRTERIRVYRISHKYRRDLYHLR